MFTCLHPQLAGRNAAVSFELAAGAALEIDLIHNVEEAIDVPVVSAKVGKRRMPGARRQTKFFASTDLENAEIRIPEQLGRERNHFRIEVLHRSANHTGSRVLP